MSFDVSALSAYTEQKKNDLIRKSLLSARTVSLVTKHPGVKYKETLNIMDGGTITFQNDGCTFSPTASTAFTQVVGTVGAIKVQEDICPTTLNQYYLQKYLNPGSADDSIGIEGMWVEMKADQIAEKIEKDVWQADVSSSGSLFDGFIKNITNVASVSGSTRVQSGSAFTPSSSINIVNQIFQSVPATIKFKDDLTIFMGVDSLVTYQTGIQQLNLFNYSGTSTGTTYKVLGFPNVTIEAVNGLNGTNFIVAARKSGLLFLTDLMSDFENFETWFSKDFQAVRFNAAFKAGTAIAFPSEITYYKY